MNDLKVCNVCQESGCFEKALEVAQIFSNLRQFQEQKFTVWRCSACNSLHSKERVVLSRYYENYFVEKQMLNYFLRCAYDNRLQLLRRYGLKKSHQLLDFDCHQGLFLSFLAQRGYQNLFGYVPYTQKYSLPEVLSRKYDVITAYDVIEHLDEPRSFFPQLVSCLKRGGLLIVGTPNADEIQLSDPVSPELHQPYHRHILSKKALINLALSEGLKVVSFSQRWYLDTLYPFVNTRFALTYVRQTGNVLDVLVEPPQWKMLLFSPKLIFYAFIGYFFRWPGNLTVVFQFDDLA